MSARTETATSVADEPSAWGGIVALGLGIFAITMSEFLPASLLPHIAGGLDVTIGEAGQAVSVTAFTAALSALLISAALPRADRRRVMVGLTLLATLSDILGALAPNLGVLLAARLLLGLALGGFWAMATAMAAQLVRPDQVGRALTVINSGVSLATVAAVPLGTWLGEVWGWRAVFHLAAALAVLAVLAQAVTLPPIPAQASSGLRALGAVLRARIVLAGLFVVLVIFSGHFGGFTYIRPAVTHLSGIRPSEFAVVLLVFGLALLVGTILSGPIADRVAQVGVLLFPAALGLGMILMLTTGSSTLWLFVAATIWGFGFGGVPTTLMSWGARTKPHRLEQVGGVLVTASNLGVAIGSLLGGLLVDRTTASAPLLIGGILAVLGGVLLSTLRR